MAASDLSEYARERPGSVRSGDFESRCQAELEMWGDTLAQAAGGVMDVSGPRCFDVLTVFPGITGQVLGVLGELMEGRRSPRQLARRERQGDEKPNNARQQGPYPHTPSLPAVSPVGGVLRSSSVGGG